MLSPGGVTLLSACERDNFGDYLLASETARRVSASLKVKFATAFPPAPDVLLPGPTELVGFNTRDRDPLWVCGGEIGAARVRDAAVYMCSAMERSKEELLTAPIIQSSGLSADELAYLPSVDVAGNPLRVRVVTSAGLAGLRLMPVQVVRSAVSVLNSCSWVSVRDVRSFDALRACGVSATLVPDTVHGLLSNTEVADGLEVEPEVAMVQMKAHWAKRRGIDLLCRQLAASNELRHRRVCFFSAGHAAGHDSADVYRRISDVLNSQYGMRTSVLEEMSPLKRARTIAESGLWIGTSLHGLIVATAFGVPAVGLSLRKLSNYAKTWSLLSPQGVEFSDIDSAVVASVASSRRGALVKKGQSLSRLVEAAFPEALARYEESSEPSGQCGSRPFSWTSAVLAKVRMQGDALVARARLKA